ncbi:MAG TPA: DoxX family protein [Thermoanaerobaculia bacterium]|nr:DoxX family protein [Thermoanaerobaculia bacterium]
MRQADVDPRSIVLIRLLVGWVFLAEGIFKFTRPEALGVGRFAKIGFVSPGLLASFVGWVEIICGALILVGFVTRLASLPLLTDILVAIVTTKLPILIGHGFWGFADPTTKPFGLGTMLHEARTDISMLLGLVFLLIAGAGRWSIDTALIERR